MNKGKRTKVRAILAGVALALGAAHGYWLLSPVEAAGGGDVTLVKKVISARRDYQTSLEQLRSSYEAAGDAERTRWCEEELRSFHRVPKWAYVIDLDVAGPGLKPEQNVPAANELYRRAMAYKGKGFGSDYSDNQIRAELLLQQLLAQYPTSNKCSDSAYQLAEIYRTRKPAMYRRSAVYYERCFQWNPATATDARLEAARLYDKQLNERSKAIELYKLAINSETEERRRQEAQRRLTELNGARD